MENRPPPNLNDPAERAAYRRELRGVARSVRLGGVCIALVGVAIGAVRALGVPEIPGLVPIVVIAWGVLLMLTAITLRTAYHARRMQGG